MWALLKLQQQEELLVVTCFGRSKKQSMVDVDVFSRYYACTPIWFVFLIMRSWYLFPNAVLQITNKLSLGSVWVLVIFLFCNDICDQVLGNQSMSFFLNKNSQQENKANKKLQHFLLFTVDTSLSFQFPPPHLLVSLIANPQKCL